MSFATVRANLNGLACNDRVLGSPPAVFRHQRDLAIAFRRHLRQFPVRKLQAPAKVARHQRRRRIRRRTAHAGRGGNPFEDCQMAAQFPAASRRPFLRRVA